MAGRTSIAVVALLACAGLARADFVEVVARRPDVSSVFGCGKATFVGGDDGLWRTRDDGASWVRVSALAVRGVWCASETDVYFVGDEAYVDHSRDGGATWTRIPIAGRPATHLFAVWGTGADDVIVAGDGGFIGESSDGGATWTAHAVENVGAQLTAIAGTTKTEDVLAIGYGKTVLRRSAGVWSAIAVTEVVGSIASTSRGFIGIGTHGARGDPPRVIRFDRTSPSPVGPNATITIDGVFARDGVVIAIGKGTIWRSTDDGATWTDRPAPGGVAIWADARAWWTVGDATVSRSIDKGLTWSAITVRRSLDTGIVWSIGGSGGKLVASGSVGAARSTDAGNTWTALAGVPAYSFILATSSGLVALGRDVTRSTDGGATWKTIGHLPESIHAAAVDGRTIVATDQSTVVMSTDAGASWSPVAGPSGKILGVWHDGGTWYLGGPNEALFVSTDLKTWRTIAGPGKRLDYVAGWASGSTIVVAAEHAILRSTDDGATWSVRTLGDRDHELYHDLVAHSGLLLASTNRGRLEGSRDGGATWTITRLPAPVAISTMWTDGGAIVLGTGRGGIWRGP